MPTKLLDIYLIHNLHYVKISSWLLTLNTVKHLAPNSTIFLEIVYYWLIRKVFNNTESTVAIS
jgi:hypothetical protein